MTTYYVNGKIVNEAECRKAAEKNRQTFATDGFDPSDTAKCFETFKKCIPVLAVKDSDFAQNLQQ